VNPKSRAEVFTYIALVAGLAWALAWAAILQEPVTSSIIPGVLFGLFMAVYGTPKLVGETQSVTYAGEKEAFRGSVNVALTQLGYTPSAQTGDFTNYKATGESSLSIGPIKLAPASFLAIGVQLGEGTATIVGPRKVVLALGRRLRTQ
jgi:hypothetical protein